MNESKDPSAPSAPPAPAAASGRIISARRWVGRWSLVGGALLLFALAGWHLTGYVGVAVALDNSSLTPFYRSAFKALWLGFSLQTALVGALVILGALYPQRLSSPALVIASLMPLSTAAVLAFFVGGFAGTTMLAVAALLVIVGAALR